MPADGIAGPLHGITVVEAASVVMAPLAGRQLAKLGADVIKVEPPGGEILRDASSPTEMSGAVLSLNEGKRSVEIDAKSDHGRAQLRQLIAGADVVLTNYLPAQRARFGLDWPTVSAINPRTILCTAQGYAADSELADEPAYDDTMQAASGLCDIYTKADGAPRLAPYILADKICGITIVYAVLAAVHRRHVDGIGQWVDVPMMDVMADFNCVEQLNDFSFVPPAGPAGWHRTVNPHRKPQPCSDGWVCVLPYTDRDWRAFCTLAGRPELIDDPRYATRAARIRHTDLVQQAISDWTSQRTMQEANGACRHHRIPVQQVNRLEDLVGNDYLRRHGSVRQVSHPDLGDYWSTNPGITFNRTPTAQVSATAFAGQHNDALTTPVEDT